MLPFEEGAAVGAPVFDKAAPNPQHYLYLNNYDFHSQDEAGYAQVSYKVTDTVKITGNVRYSADQKWGTEDARYVDFSSAFIDPLQGIFGAQTPSFDINPLETCPTGIGLAGSAT